MAETQGKFEILTSVGHAVRFVREHWRFLALVAAIASATHLLSLLTLGQLALAAFTLIWAATNTAMLSANLRGVQSVPARLAPDLFRVWLALAMLGVVLFVIALAFTFIAMSVLLAPYLDVLEAAKNDERRTLEILGQAVREQPMAGLAVGVPLALSFLYVTSRFFLVAPATIDQGRIQFFSSWTWTAGSEWKIIAARLIVLGPAYVLVVSLQTLTGAALGLGILMPWDMTETQALATTAPLRLVSMALIGQFLQIGVFSALEAGLAASMYRALKPTAA